MADNCEFKWGPDFTYHMIQGHAPRIFISFWIVAAISLLVTTVVVTPTMWKLLKAGIQIRDEQNTILMPSSYRSAIVILAFPPIAAFCVFIILLNPSTANCLNFVNVMYGSYTLVVFALLVAQYLGLHHLSNPSVNDSWQQQLTPSKFYAVPPCCCMKSCVAERVIAIPDLRRLSILVLQFAVIGPMASFLQLFPGLAESHKYIFIIIQMVSVNVCIYATNVILAATKDVLKGYSMTCIYNIIQLGFNLWWLPSFIIGLIHIKDLDEVYTKDVMVQAYAAVAQSVLWILLSIVYRYYFNLTRADEAHSSVASLSTSYIKMDDQDVQTI
mmetsp:Transcript_27888/g.44212  ORF Transcript_27888/g.44212 Transcript_27888/m.44212 type:complete len:328 (-) Transcript_27888:191-1174(-)